MDNNHRAIERIASCAGGEMTQRVGDRFI